MSDYFQELTRWDATHTKSITIDYQGETFGNPIKEDIDYFGLTVLTGNERVADVFGVDLEKDCSIIDKAVLDAIAVGDRVFYIQYGKHSTEWVHIQNELPKRTWDSGCAGVLIVHKEKWHEAMPQCTFARNYVEQELQEAFDDRVTACLNGWLYEAIIEENSGCTYIRDGYLTPEEALQDAMSEFPDIKYKDDDFDEEETFVLKAV